MTAETHRPDNKGRRPVDTLAARLVLIRHELGVTQKEAAAATHIPIGTWQGMEAGRASRGLNELIQAISETYGYDRDWLMWGDLPGGEVHPAA